MSHVKARYMEIHAMAKSNKIEGFFYPKFTEVLGSTNFFSLKFPKFSWTEMPNEEMQIWLLFDEHIRCYFFLVLNFPNFRKNSAKGSIFVKFKKILKYYII